MLKKVSLQKNFVDSYTEVLGEKHTKTNSKRRNWIIFLPPDEIIQHSKRKMKVGHQKDHKNKAIIFQNSANVNYDKTKFTSFGYR